MYILKRSDGVSLLIQSTLPELWHLLYCAALNSSKARVVQRDIGDI